jgi:hypothetical protein
MEACRFAYLRLARIRGGLPATRICKKMTKYGMLKISLSTTKVWAYNTTWNTTTGFTPYELVYGKNAMLPIDFEIATLRTTSNLNLDLSSAQKEILQHLNSLDEYMQ